MQDGSDFRTPRVPDRRGRDRRVIQIPFDGPEKRKRDRREAERRKNKGDAAD